MRARLGSLIVALMAALASCSDPVTTQVSFGEGRVAGRVLNGYSRTVAGARVALNGRFGVLETVTSLEGAYAFEGLPEEGLATLVASIDADSVVQTVDLAKLTPFPVTVIVPQWSLAWSDEFDGERLDRRWWHVWSSPAEGRTERHWYLPSQVTLENGMLRLRTDAPRADGYCESGGVNTLYSQRYGRFEIRARLPATQGIWPAHWLVNHDSLDPVFEIDIMELLGASPRTVYFHNHWFTSAAIVTGTGSSYTGEDFSEDFHTYRVDWYVGNIDWYVDGVRRFHSVSGIGDRAAHLRLCTAVGGNWGGPTDETTRFPQYHDIDWVRVYRLVE